MTRASREDIIDGFAAFYALHDLAKGKERFARLKRANDLFSTCRSAFSGAPFYRGRDTTPYELEPGALEVYFALVDKFKGRDAANEAILSYARVGWPWGVTVVVENSDDDPFRVNFHVSDAIASDWADANGSLDGGTWETCDGTDFVYDTGQWSPDLFDRLRKGGFDLDFSNWFDPDEDDIAAARHAHDCDECQEHWDFSRIREHIEKLKEPLVELAQEIISREEGCDGNL